MLKQGWSLFFYLSLQNYNRLFMSRKIEFQNIKEKLHSHIYYADEQAMVFNDDALNILKIIPEHSVSLILTDPPYHSTKKENIINDKAFSSDNDFIEWMECFAVEWKRILRFNGSIFMYCSSAMEAKLEIMLSKYFNVLSHIVWTKPNEPGFDGWKGKMKKEALRQWYPHSERIIFCEPALEGNLKRSYFGAMLKDKRTACNLSGHQLTEMIGAYGKVNHGGAVSNWESGRNIPSREQYSKICEALEINGLQEKMPCYEDAIRPFEVNASVEFTDVWTFPSVKPYNGKHPAEKPLEMLEHCINSTTFENDIVLDCFAGSGSSLLSALKSRRYAIGIEIDNKWCCSIKNRLQTFSQLPVKELNGSKLMKGSLQTNNMPTLF